MTFSLDDLIAEVDRELAQRKIIYPRRVRNGSLAEGTAERQIGMLIAVREILARLLAAEKESSVQPNISVDRIGQ